MYVGIFYDVFWFMMFNKIVEWLYIFNNVIFIEKCWIFFVFVCDFFLIIFNGRNCIKGGVNVWSGCKV